jgi:hypothetical protein
MAALFHNQESSLRADKSVQMFYGEEGGRGSATPAEKFPEKKGRYRGGNGVELKIFALVPQKEQGQNAPVPFEFDLKLI